MLIEINVKDEIIKRTTALAEKCKHDLKMVLAICRVPRLCNKFQEACKKKEGKTMFEILEKRAQNKIFQSKGTVPED